MTNQTSNTLHFAELAKKILESNINVESLRIIVIVNETEKKFNIKILSLRKNLSLRDNYVSTQRIEQYTYSVRERFPTKVAKQYQNFQTTSTWNLARTAFP